MNNQTSSVVDATKNIDQKRAFSVTVIRNCQEGLQIRFQSPLDWSFLRAKDNEAVKNIGKVVCYVPAKERLPNVPGWFSGTDWEFDDYPNLWLLLAKDLQRGVTFNFGVIPVSEEKIAIWIDKLKRQVKIMYLQYIKPVNTSVVFSTQTVESEEHD